MLLLYCFIAGTVQHLLLMNTGQKLFSMKGNRAVGFLCNNFMWDEQTSLQEYFFSTGLLYDRFALPLMTNSE